MRASAAAFLLFAAAFVRARGPPADPRLLVLPPPVRLTLRPAADAVRVAAARVAVTGCEHPYVALAEARFNARLPRRRSSPQPPAAAAAAELAEVRVEVAGGCAAAPPALLPREDTHYDYSLVVDAASGAARVAASSVFGVVYALETLLQLVSANDGTVPPCDVEDAPAYAMRGVLLDTGRRFVPLPFVLNLLDTMVATKLNVLHLHASDQCRFAVESQLFPNLTASLTGSMGGFYSQADVRAMVAAAAARGIRVVPEFDVPSHAHGLLPIRGAGLKFCGEPDPGPDAEELFNDPANSTLSVLNALFAEMAGLFPDELMSIGADETDCTPMCTCDSIAALERALIENIEGPLWAGRAPAGRRCSSKPRRPAGRPSWRHGGTSRPRTSSPRATARSTPTTRPSTSRGRRGHSPSGGSPSGPTLARASTRPRGPCCSAASCRSGPTSGARPGSAWAATRRPASAARSSRRAWTPTSKRRSAA